MPIKRNGKPRPKPAPKPKPVEVVAPKVAPEVSRAVLIEKFRKRVALRKAKGQPVAQEEAVLAELDAGTSKKASKDHGFVKALKEEAERPIGE